MTYENFKEELMANLTSRFPEDTQFQVKRILKNNDLSLDGLLISNPSVNISPTIYLNDYYQEYLKGCSILEICDSLVSCYENHKLSESIDISFFTDFSQVRDNIIFKLIHTKQNQELLASIPHISYYDLSIVFCYYLPPECCFATSDDTNATILVRNEHLRHWNQTTDSLYALAKKNSPRLFPPQVQRLPELLCEMWDAQSLEDMDMDSASEEVPLYVLSNRGRFFGASTLLYDGVLNTCWQKLGSAFYIIPSSIHEVLLLPTSHDIGVTELNAMVQDVNKHHVATEEILSDHVYLYNNGELSFVS